MRGTARSGPGDPNLNRAIHVSKHKRLSVQNELEPRIDGQTAFSPCGFVWENVNKDSMSRVQGVSGSRKTEFSVSLTETYDTRWHRQELIGQSELVTTGRMVAQLSSNLTS